MENYGKISDNEKIRLQKKRIARIEKENDKMFLALLLIENPTQSKETKASIVSETIKSVLKNRI